MLALGNTALAIAKRPEICHRYDPAQNGIMCTLSTIYNRILEHCSNLLKQLKNL